MSRSDPPPVEETWRPPRRATLLLVVAIIVVGTLFGFMAFYLVGNAEEAPDTSFEIEQYGQDGQQLRLGDLSGEPINDPETIVVFVDGERVATGSDWANSADGLDEDSALYVAEDADGEVVVADDPEHESFERGLIAGTGVEVLWASSSTDSTAALATHEVEFVGE
ncbi:type IV pilin [Natranaeroarchaeum aerophilus]|uniref:Archaeal Type IV pilin N-terminal domain-containing protein n=1 Tax=Natranaeroarchaeum aerophilus TaxID=2917711 RepID=A0AAE3K8E8_9EURY|nr:type IV pilin [Natranaeroarchaeum aerophilus]MCL9814904.1 hypothetical protein [Natranaeroarchaeum aerophilus]